jgi:hypothetical protein
MTIPIKRNKRKICNSKKANNLRCIGTQVDSFITFILIPYIVFSCISFMLSLLFIGNGAIVVIVLKYNLLLGILIGFILYLLEFMLDWFASFFAIKKNNIRRHIFNMLAIFLICVFLIGGIITLTLYLIKLIFGIMS